jgi:chromosome partitioning protein
MSLMRRSIDPAISALVATELAIIPLKPAIEDIDVAIATFELIREINETPERSERPIKTVMVLTMTMQGTVIARHVRNQLEEAGYPWRIRNRRPQPEHNVTDPDGAAARDIAAPAQEIIKITAVRSKREEVQLVSGGEIG